MAEYTANFNPENLFVKETAAVYSSAIKDLSEPFKKYNVVELLLRNYTFKDDLEEIEIIHFIFENWFLVSILTDAPKKISAIFGNTYTIVLELFVDPEDNNGTGKLFVVIRTNEELDESLKKFDQLLNIWFNSIIIQTNGLLNITVESKDEF